VGGDPSWQDYAVEAELSAEGDEVGLVFRYSDDGTRRYYRLRLNAAGRYLERISDSDVEILWQDSVVYTPATNQVVVVQCFGQRLRGQLGSELLFDIVDNDGFAGGQIGLYTNTTAVFERVLVREWPGSVLAAETLYQAELAASYVLFQAEAWPVAPEAAGWLELVATDSPKRRMIVIGQEGWENYRLEVTFNTFRSESVGFLLRVEINSDETFQCYRLLFNPDNQSLQMSRLMGTCDLNRNTYSVEERDLLWSCNGAMCGIDFSLDEHDLAFTCDGDQFLVEIDGRLVGVAGDGAIVRGKIGLYYNGMEALPTAFDDVILRSTPRGKIYDWQFSTSLYPGFVEHLDSFTGVVHNDVERRPASADLSAVIVEASAALTDATSIVLTARSALAAASAAEFSQMLADVLDALDSYNRTSISFYESLHQLFFDGIYRPCPPVVELTELFGDEGRCALLLESPEPLDWNRLSFTLERLTRTGSFVDINANTIVVWSNDGIRALLLSSSGESLPNGTYQLQLTFYLDIGAEAPVLRRNGSIVPETVALHFDLTN
jgi:hypothetical protein